MTFLLDCWYVAAASAEVLPGKLLARRLLGEPVILYRTADGEIVAMEDRCPHRSAPLSGGVLLNDTVRCGYHGLEFGRDGRCTAVPGQKNAPPGSRARVFPAVERFRLIWIWMGNIESADPARIPDVHWLDDPEWVAASGYHHVAANFRLLNDNLLDLSHETYVHQRTIGNEAVADSPARVRCDESGVYVNRDIPSCQPPPFFQHLAHLKSSALIRRWQRTVYRPASHIVIDVGAVPLEDASGMSIDARVINLMTPESETSTHYFWRFARNFRLDEAQLTSFIEQAIASTFDEDKAMLEAQQANLAPGITDPMRKLAIKSDAAPVAARRMLEARIAAENAIA